MTPQKKLKISNYGRVGADKSGETLTRPCGKMITEIIFGSKVVRDNHLLNKQTENYY
jgi:hypothetical protein